MDLSLLIPFLSKTAAAGLSVSPDEVVIQMKKDKQKNTKDKENDTVDGDVVDHDHQVKKVNKNIEGELMGNSFEELDVQAAIDRVKDRKRKGLTPKDKKNCDCDDTDRSQTKTASYWDLLSSRLNK